jgi:biopolymer transport protein TolR
MEMSVQGDGPVATINIVPLVDIMLVLLVIFMVTAPMMQQGVEVSLPKAATGALRGNSEQVVLSIDKTGAVFLGAGNAVEVDALAVKVNAIMERRPVEDRKVFIKADKALDYGRVMEVMAALHSGGITQVGLVSDAPDRRTSQGAVQKGAR